MSSSTLFRALPAEWRFVFVFATVAAVIRPLLLAALLLPLIVSIHMTQVTVLLVVIL
jgi:hypothetical protein